MATKQGMTRKSKTTATKYKQGRNLTFYFNAVKRSGPEKREDSFLMVDSEELIELADDLREGTELTSQEISKILLQIVLDEGSVNMSFGDEEKTDSSTHKFTADDIRNKYLAASK